MKLGQFHTIHEPDLPACWLYRNVRVKGYVGEVEGEFDQHILRPIEYVFQEAVTAVRTELPDGRPELLDAELTDENCARIVDAKSIDDYGSIVFKFKWWGIPER